MSLVFLLIHVMLLSPGNSFLERIRLQSVCRFALKLQSSEKTFKVQDNQVNAAFDLL